MGRRKSFDKWRLSDGPFPCYFGCGRELRTKFDRQAIEGWDWFTGYGENPVHFCPKCRRSREFEIDRIREKLNIRPKDYPKVRAQP